MKWFGVLFLFLGLSALAHNPQIHVCKVTGGVFHIIGVEGDEVGFCQYKEAFMDSLSMLDVTSGGDKSSAIEAFEDSIASSCEEAHAENLKGFDLEDQGFDLCLFEDGSMIELETLQKGSSDQVNAGLLKAIQVRF